MRILPPPPPPRRLIIHTIYMHLLFTPSFIYILNIVNYDARRVIGGRIVLGRSPAAEALGVGRGGPAVAAARGAPNIAMFRDKMERMQNILETMHDYGRK